MENITYTYNFSCASLYDDKDGGATTTVQDALASLALYRDTGDCENEEATTNSCIAATSSALNRKKASPDAYINEHLGAPESCERHFYEEQARTLAQLINSAEARKASMSLDEAQTVRAQIRSILNQTPSCS